MLNASCHFYVPERRCSIKCSVGNCPLRVGRDTNSWGSSPCRRPGTARWNAHLPYRDELQFGAAVVAGAQCEMCLWQGLLRVQVEQLQFTAEDI